MAPRRMVDPSIWQSETMAELTRCQRLLFIGLFSNADDQGRLRSHPAVVRATVFPYDDIPLDEMKTDLASLIDGGFVLCYEADGKGYLQIINWWKYQSPQWAYPSKIPAPDGWTDHLRYRRDNQVKKENWPPDALGKSLPKDLPNADSQSDGRADSISTSTSVSTSTSSTTVPAEAGADAPPPPSTFEDWQETIRASKNRPSTLVWMFKTLYTGSDPPDYGRIGKAAKRVGGAGRLAELMWQHSTRPPTGNVIDYLEKCAKAPSRGPPSTDGKTPAQRAAEEFLAEEEE